MVVVGFEVVVDAQSKVVVPPCLQHGNVVLPCLKHGGDGDFTLGGGKGVLSSRLSSLKDSSIGGKCSDNSQGSYQRYVSELLDVRYLMLALMEPKLQVNYMGVGAFDLIN
ncbi:hypothetical protein Tco_0963310 [Tanacetum coccineum]